MVNYRYWYVKECIFIQTKSHQEIADSCTLKIIKLNGFGKIFERTLTANIIKSYQVPNHEYVNANSVYMWFLLWMGIEHQYTNDEPYGPEDAKSDFIFVKIT